MSSRKPTSHDVARLAGVSQTTVSYVMSKRRSVAPETEQRVLQAMEKLGYQPNSGARALRSNRSKLIGVVVPYHTGADPGAQHQFLISTASHLRKRGYDLVLMTSNEGPAGLRRVIDTALCDGLLIMEVLADDSRTSVICESNTPAVFIGIPGNPDPVIAIDSDYEYAGREAVAALANRGHEEIIFLNPRDPSLNELNFLIRFRNGVLSEASSRPLRIRETPVDVSYRDIMRTLDELMPRHGDAFLLGPLVPVDDWSNAMRSKGLEPGVDVSVIATSWDPIRTHSLNEPTRFDMQTPLLTSRAVSLLLDRLDSPPPREPVHHLIAPVFHEGTTLMPRSTRD